MNDLREYAVNAAAFMTALWTMQLWLKFTMAIVKQAQEDNPFVRKVRLFFHVIVTAISIFTWYLIFTGIF